MMNRIYCLFLLAVSTVIATRVQAANLVSNGDFETGPGPSGDPIPDWTSAGYLVDTFIVSNRPSPHTGTYALHLGANNGVDNQLTQTLGTTAGQSYELTYWLSSDGMTPNDFKASFEGTVLFTSTDLPQQPYTQYTFDVQAASTTGSVLEFDSQDKPGFLGLDDVSIVPIPEPSTFVLAVLAGGLLVLRNTSVGRRVAGR